MALPVSAGDAALPLLGGRGATATLADANPERESSTDAIVATTTTAVPKHGPSLLRTFAMSTNFASIPSHLSAHPEEARTLGNLNETCLHWSCFHRGPAYAILPIAASYPEATGIVGACGRSPLHIVCAGGGRGTVNALEETVDLVEKLAGYNPNMCVLVSVEDGETPLSGLWGVYSRQCEDVLGGVLTKLGVGNKANRRGEWEGDDEEEVSAVEGKGDNVGVAGGFDEEFAAMMRRILLERREERTQNACAEKEGEDGGLNDGTVRPLVPAPQPQPRRMVPAWASELAELEHGSGVIGGGASSATAVAVSAANRKRNRSARSISPPRTEASDKHVRIQLPALDLGGPCECPYKNNPDPVDMPRTFTSATEEMDENVRTLVVQIEKMLMLIHAADYVFATYHRALPKPLAAESPIGGHFIFHPPPEKSLELEGRSYEPYWTDNTWDPIQGAVRVYERLGDLGVPPSFLRLLVGLYSDPDREGKSYQESPASSDPHLLRSWPLHTIFSSKSVPASIVGLVLERSPSAAKIPRSLSPLGRYALHAAISSGRSWSDGVSSVLDAHPAALGTRDTTTGLYPFMLAAAATAAVTETSPARMKLGEDKHMVPRVVIENDDADAKEAEEEQRRQLLSLETVYKLLLECPVLVNSSGQTACT